MSNESRTTLQIAGISQRQKTRVVMSQREYLVGLTVRTIVIVLAVCFALFPVVFIASSAFNPEDTLGSGSLVPRNVNSLDDATTNFRALMIDDLDVYPFWNWILNSVVVASVSTLLIVLITALSAYSFSRFRFRGRRTLLLGVLLIQVFPNLLAMVALFLILLEIGRLATAIPDAMPFLSFFPWSFIERFSLDSLGGLILIYMGGAMVSIPG